MLIKHELDKLNYPRLENLYVILDMIYRRNIYFKTDLQKYYGYSEICRKTFLELIPRPAYLQEDIQFLIDKKFIMRNEYYVYGLKPKGYKITREYLSNTVGVIIQDKKINARIFKQIVKQRQIKVENLNFQKTKYYNNLKIDYSSAIAAIEHRTFEELKALCSKIKIELTDCQILDIIRCRGEYIRYKGLILLLLKDRQKEFYNIIHRCIIHTTQVNAIHDGYLFFKRNKTNGRLDTNLTSLPSYLRPYIISNEKLKNLDIKNSQPFFLYTVLINNNSINTLELETYSHLVTTGQIYEYLNKEYYKLYEREKTREQIKKTLFKIFYSKNCSYVDDKAFFRKLFPSIMEFIDITNSKEHNTLAIKLQQEEARVVLDVIMPRLQKSGIVPFTIHDCFICTEKEEITVSAVLNCVFNELYNIIPSFSSEYLINIEDEDDQIEDFEEFINELNKEA